MRRPSSGRKFALVAVIAVGAALGGAAAQYWFRTQIAPGVAADGVSGAELRSLIDDVTTLKQLVPSQSHTMADVGDHWSNLWFAAQRKNWPLARFYFDEARQHIRWTLLIRPVRQGADGAQIDIKGLFDGLDLSAFATVQLALEDADTTAFETSYKVALDACYACHVAAEKAFLRPIVPVSPGQNIIDLNPKAE